MPRGRSKAASQQPAAETVVADDVNGATQSANASDADDVHSDDSVIAEDLASYTKLPDPPKFYGNPKRDEAEVDDWARLIRDHVLSRGLGRGDAAVVFARMNLRVLHLSGRILGMLVHCTHWMHGCRRFNLRSLLSLSLPVPARY